MPLIAIYGPEKRCNFFRIGKGCMMLFSRLRQCPFEIAGRVTLCPSGGDGVPENLTGDSPDSVCGFKCTLYFLHGEEPSEVRVP